MIRFFCDCSRGLKTLPIFHNLLLDAGILCYLKSMSTPWIDAQTSLRTVPGPDCGQRRMTGLCRRNLGAALCLALAGLLIFAGWCLAAPQGGAPMSTGDAGNVLAPAVSRPLVVACPAGYPPFAILDDQGEPAGLYVDIWRLWSQHTGIPVHFRTGTWPEALDWLRNGEVDVHCGLLRSPDRQTWIAFSRPFFEMDLALVVPASDKATDELEDLAGHSVAVVRHSYQADWLRQNQPSTSPRVRGSDADMVQALLDGEAQALFTEWPSAVALLDRLERSGEFRILPLPRLRQTVHAAVHRNNSALLETVNQGLAAITPREMAALEERWLSRPEHRVVDIRETDALRFADQEREWVRRHPDVRVGLTRGHLPLRPPHSPDRQDAALEPATQGLAMEYVQRIAGRAGLRPQVRADLRPAQRFGALRRGQVDVLACVQPTPSLRREFLFTQPYLRLPSVIVTRTDAPFLTGLADLAGQVVMVPQHSGRAEYLYRDFPDLDLRLAPDVDKALEAVSLGRAMAAVGDLPTLARAIRSQGLTNLKVAARTEYEHDEFAMAVRKELPDLASILDRSIAALSPEDRNVISAHWLQAGLMPDEKYQAFWNLALRVGGAGLLILALLLLWNWRLNKEVRRRRRTEQALALAERELREVYDQVPVGIFKTSPDGRVLSVNPEMLRIGGYVSLDEVRDSGTGLLKHWYADEADRTHLLNRLLETGEVTEFLYRARRKDETLIWVSHSARLVRDEQGNPLYISGYALDATERIEALECLRRSETRLKAIVENSPFVILTMDDDLRLDLPLDSPAVERITTYRPDELRGQLFVDYVHPEDALRSDYQLRRFLASPGESVSIPCRWRTRNGVWRQLECSGVNFKNNPDYSGVLFIIRDVTTEREAQERLVQARLTAENADRAKSEFLASMSHEIRTPMNAILGMADVLSETELDEEQRSYVELFRNAGESLMSLIDDILDLSKVEAGQVHLEHIPFNPRELVEKVTHIMGIRARKNGVALEADLPDDLPEIMLGDPGRLRQVLANLLSNAVKFTHQGRIDLIVRRESQPQGPDQLRFSVRDTGIGIPPNKIKDIFESFVQADSSTTRRYGGTGLGLTISQRLVSLMKGRIWVESEVGKGSAFHISLPLDEPAHDENDPARRQAEDELEKALPPANVLLVEDTESNRTLVEAFLEPTALRLDMAGDGREALEKFSSKHYDLVLMDMQLPVMNGYDAVRAIRKMEKERGMPRTPVFALTAFALKGDAEKCIQAGCDVHIAKPVLREDFLAILLEHLKPGAEGGEAPAPQPEGGSPG
jgi:PAS domain S-box-containing protein